MSGDGVRGRRLAVLLCAAGAGLALFAATRVWVVEVTARPAPLPELRHARSGADLLPWLSPLAVVALAGTGAVLATRAVARRVVGALLLLVNLALVGGGAYGVRLADTGEPRVLWPVLCAVGGLLAAVGGVLVVLRGRDWPGIGPRYDGAARGGAARALAADGTAAVWDALDRGEDPTDEEATRPVP